MTNILQCKNLIQDLYNKGVRTFVLCAGARNAGFIECFAKLDVPANVDVHWGFEERSASFFALGRAKASGYAAAIFTTSGTATVETHAALIEAYYSGVPMVVVSADRPMKLWGTGAPQTIIQKDLFATHLGHTVNWTDTEAVRKAVFPMHINCPMSEPLIDEDVMRWKLNTAKTVRSQDLRTLCQYESFKNLDLNTLIEEYDDICKPFFILSGLKPQDIEVVAFLNQYQCPIFVEATADIFEFKNKISSEVFDLEFVRKNFDCVIRVGGIPTHKIWRQLEEERGIPVLNFSASKFPGRSDSSVYCLEILRPFVQNLKLPTMELMFDSIVDPKSNMIEDKENSENNYLKILSLFKEREDKLAEIFLQHPNSEMSLVAQIKKQVLSSDAKVFLGNSLPIRTWDMVLLSNHAPRLVLANRGVNGIDGLLSTAYGLAYKSLQPVIAIVGDLSALYDLVAPWFYTQGTETFNSRIVVINNGGGQIFSSLFTNPNFINAHNLRFKHFAALWGLSYVCVENITALEQLGDIQKWPQVVEVVPNNQETSQVWKKIKENRL